MIESKLTTKLLNVLCELDDKAPAHPFEVAHAFCDMQNIESRDLLDDLVGHGLAVKLDNGQYDITDEGECIAINY